ncbi:hypothetical protein MKX57_11060 [Lysinibacillus sp. FSL M8-0216]|uniref:hypothetical protein n=1 Tax=Lysinibacillus sp. FSL M8-0216 TaxID=2921619 RepID=UPI00315A959C
MAEISSFFDSSEYHVRKYSAEDFSEVFSTFLSTGLVHTNNNPMLYIEQDVEDNLKVVLSKGIAMIEGHMYKNTDNLFFNIKPLENSFSRIDRLVIRCDERPEVKSINAFIVEGLPSVNPAPPTITRSDGVYELSVCQIVVNTNNTLNIIDERLDDSVCGLSHSRFSIPMDKMIEDFAIFKDQLNTQYNDWIQNVEQGLDVPDLRKDFELMKRNYTELIMQRNLEGKVGAGERGFFYDNLADNKKIDVTNTTAVVDTDNMSINLNPSSLNGHVTWKTHPVGFVASKIEHFHTRPIGQLLEVVETAYGGSNQIKVKNIEVTLTEVI